MVIDETALRAGLHSPSAERIKLIEAKEAAVIKALKILKTIHDKFRAASFEPIDMDLPAWRLRLSELDKKQKGFQHRVGILGDTGIGKSSLLNALVSEKADIAPSSQNGACTAAICCFEYFEPPDSSKKYRAKIDYKSKSEVDKELNHFFAELKVFESQETSESQHDAVAQAERNRFGDNLNIISNWSGLPTEKLRTLGLGSQSGKITLDCVDGKRFFDYEHPDKSKTETFYSPTPPAFLQSIKPFAGSGGKKSKDKMIWPVVKLVHVYVQADVLKSGVVLIDLPGLMDALDSRSQIARDFYNKLHSRIIVTPGDRASDNRTAMFMLQQDQILDLDTDGKMNEDSLCIATSKVDLLDWQNFVESEISPDEVSPRFQLLYQEYEQKRQRLQEVNGEIQDLKEEGGDSTPIDFETKSYDSQKRASSTTTSAYLGSTDESRILHSLFNERKELELQTAKLKGMCHYECIQARNRHNKEALQEKFDKVRNSSREDGAPQVHAELTVFPVSSKAHRLLAKGEPDPAFPDAYATGVQVLKDWIIRGSLEAREKNADHLFSMAQVLLDEVDGWIMDGCQIVVKLAAAELPKIKALIQELLNVLEKRLKASHVKLHDGIKNLPPNQLKSHNKFDSELAKGFVGHVNNYQISTTTGKKIHCASYLALIRRRGGQFLSQGQHGKETHDLRSRLYIYFWGPRVAMWTTAFQNTLPQLGTVAEAENEESIKAHVLGIQQSPNLHQVFKEAFEERSSRLDNLLAEYQTGLDDLLTTYEASVAEIKKSANDLLDKAMIPVYDAARDQKGTGATMRQYAAMEEGARRIQSKIFPRVSKGLSRKLESVRNKFEKEHERMLLSLIDKIKVMLTSLASMLCLSKNHEADGLMSPEQILEFRSSLTTSFQVWKREMSISKSLFTAHAKEGPQPERNIKTEAGASDLGLIAVMAATSNALQSATSPVFGTPTESDTSREGHDKLPSISTSSEEQATNTRFFREKFSVHLLDRAQTEHGESAPPMADLPPFRRESLGL
ncbi:hypothetical protein S40288_01546 [Stachybotrys chartarum IBT 40288]|nr:hypothetical protein S40288_01546 [Stachybotrys chartarum IBT 40288]